MKAIRIATLAAALCVGTTSVGAAQSTEPQQGQGQGEARRGGGMGGTLLKDITLTDAQKAQVKAILWRYIGGAHRTANLPGRVTLDAKWYIGQELVAYGRKPADYDQAAFQGIHARYVLVIIDEAGGVPKSIFDAVDALGQAFPGLLHRGFDRGFDLGRGLEAFV